MNEQPKILLVDDRRENLIALEKSLADLDAEFVRAISGNEALAMTLDSEFALALIDVQMPEMDGFETLKLMRQDTKTRMLPVIFVTAIYSEEYYEIKGIESGAVDFLMKPIVPEILRGKVNVLLDLYKQKKDLRCVVRAQEALLLEVNHRVKNNLSAIIGMFHMEKERAKIQRNDRYKALLGQMVKRLQGLLTVHCLLSESKWQPVSVRVLCEKVIANALQGLPPPKNIDFAVIACEAKVDSNRSHHLALVINELTTNTVKHASNGKDNVRIEVKVEERNSLLKISYRDNGSGFPQEMTKGDLSNAKIGIELIQGIVTYSLGGTVEFSNCQGAVTSISFENH